MSAARAPFLPDLRALLPGLVLAGGVALVALSAEWALKLIGGKSALPAMVLALLIGIALHRVAANPVFEAGLTYAVKTLLRYAIALLGLRIALSDIAALGFGSVLVVMIAMALTILISISLARAFGQEAGLGALAGAANAVCGASATLATASVVPDYKTKAADIAFCVVMANALSTLVMLAYPPLCALFGLNEAQTGLLLGLTIHDMAQVVGAGYAISEPVGNNAVIVKLFRVFLLLPVVLSLGLWFRARGATSGKAQVPVPGFALAFLSFCLLNSWLSTSPWASGYAPVKAMVSQLANGGMLVAIAALGLGTSLSALLSIGWRHIALFLAGTTTILLLALGGLKLLG